MPKIICDAVTCKHNKGNANFTENYIKGSFECIADEIIVFENTEDCECGKYRDESYCKAYERQMRSEL